MKRICNFIKSNLRPTVAVIIFVIAWQLLVYFELVNSIFISSPLEVGLNFFELIGSSYFYDNAAYSAYSLMMGILMAIVFGVILGLLLGSNKKIGEYLKFYIYTLSAMPLVIVIPLIIAWFGFGINSKIIIVFFMALVPIVVSMMEGAGKINLNLINMGRSFGASEIAIARKVVFFGVLPFLSSGVKISIGRAIAGVIIAEMYGYGKGLGYLISFYGSTFQIAKLMAVMMVLILFNFLFIGIVCLFERKIIKWN